jgi:hypothetical protein
LDSSINSSKSAEIVMRGLYQMTWLGKNREGVPRLTRSARNHAPSLTATAPGIHYV